MNGDKSDEYWEQLNRETQELVKKHGADMFVKELIVTIINELARKE